ncbi:hypothetical protein GCM10028813_26980 [Ramlibacter alkalitolerans]
MLTHLLTLGKAIPSDCGEEGHTVGEGRHCTPEAFVHEQSGPRAALPFWAPAFAAVTRKSALTPFTRA